MDILAKFFEVLVYVVWEFYVQTSFNLFIWMNLLEDTCFCLAALSWLIIHITVSFLYSSYLWILYTPEGLFRLFWGFVNLIVDWITNFFILLAKLYYYPIEFPFFILKGLSSWLVNNFSSFIFTPLLHTIISVIGVWVDLVLLVLSTLALYGIVCSELLTILSVEFLCFFYGRFFSALVHWSEVLDNWMFTYLYWTPIPLIFYFFKMSLFYDPTQLNSFVWLLFDIFFVRYLYMKTLLWWNPTKNIYSQLSYTYLLALFIVLYLLLFNSSLYWSSLLDFFSTIDKEFNPLDSILGLYFIKESTVFNSSWPNLWFLVVVLFIKAVVFILESIEVWPSRTLIKPRKLYFIRKLPDRFSSFIAKSWLHLLIVFSVIPLAVLIFSSELLYLVILVINSSSLNLSNYASLLSELFIVIEDGLSLLNLSTPIDLLLVKVWFYLRLVTDFMVSVDSNTFNFDLDYNMFNSFSWHMYIYILFLFQLLYKALCRLLVKFSRRSLLRLILVLWCFLVRCIVVTGFIILALTSYWVSYVVLLVYFVSWQYLLFKFKRAPMLIKFGYWQHMPRDFKPILEDYDKFLLYKFLDMSEISFSQSNISRFSFYDDSGDHILLWFASYAETLGKWYTITYFISFFVIVLGFMTAVENSRVRFRYSRFVFSLSCWPFIFFTCAEVLSIKFSCDLLGESKYLDYLFWFFLILWAFLLDLSINVGEQSTRKFYLYELDEWFSWGFYHYSYRCYPKALVGTLVFLFCWSYLEYILHTLYQLNTWGYNRTYKRWYGLFFVDYNYMHIPIVQIYRYSLVYAIIALFFTAVAFNLELYVLSTNSFCHHKSFRTLSILTLIGILLSLLGWVLSLPWLVTFVFTWIWALFNWCGSERVILITFFPNPYCGTDTLVKYKFMDEWEREWIFI